MNIIGLDLKKDISLLVSGDIGREEIATYEAVSVTASIYSARDWYSIYKVFEKDNGEELAQENFNKVNAKQEIGVDQKDGVPTFFFTPKTKGSKDVSVIFGDLMNAVNALGIKELLMLEWGWLRQFPNIEIESIFNYLLLNKNKIKLKKLYFDIDPIYQVEFIEIFEEVFSTKVSDRDSLWREFFASDTGFTTYLQKVAVSGDIKRGCDCGPRCTDKFNGLKVIWIEDLKKDRHNFDIYLMNVFLQGIHKYKREKYDAAVRLFDDYAILVFHAGGFFGNVFCPPNHLKPLMDVSNDENVTREITNGVLRQILQEGLNKIDEGGNKELFRQILDDDGV